ncbi:MAG TPA: TolC family protein [Candidatus Angelobacter sp.]|nr:TolC family protein [Candidatus Angelobacter sp.]
MLRASLFGFFALLPNLIFGQVTLPISSSPALHKQAATPAAASSAAQPTPSPVPSATPAATLITLDQAIALALAHSPSILATRTEIQQNQAQEITANLRPNPTLFADSQFIPIFQPGSFSGNTLNNLQQFDVGVGYLFERGHKRQSRLKAARDATSVTAAQVADAERTLTFNVAQQFINALLANSNLNFAKEDLNSFQQTVGISEQRYRAGDISEGDFLKIKLQLLQFQTDVSSARVAHVQALNSLRQLLGYASVPHNFDVAGDLEYQPLKAGLMDLQARALKERPDLRAAQQGIAAAQSQVSLARANGKQDVNGEITYTHVSGVSSTSLFFNIPLPIFNRNQGEIARTRFAQAQAELNARSSQDTVMTDVENGYEAALTNQQVVELYNSGYLKQAQDSRDISEYAYRAGAATLLDFLDAERSYRATQLAYRQALAAYMVSLEQLRQAVGSRSLP